MNIHTLKIDIQLCFPFTFYSLSLKGSYLNQNVEIFYRVF